MSVQNQFGGAATGALTVRFSQPSDVPAVLDFYKSNLHHNVDFRGEDVFTDRTEKGRALLVFLPDNTLGASSMSHPFTAPDGDNKNASWTEIGSTLARVDGFGLYPFMIASQIIHEFIDKTPDAAFFACIHKENTAVTALLNQKVGWNIVTPAQDFADAVGEGANIAKLNWLHATSDTLAHQARIVLDHIQRGHVENRKTGEKLALDLRGFSLAQEFRHHVEELAGGRFGEMLENSLPLPLKAARIALQNYQAGRQYFPQLTAKP